jgi:hypothetical protein
MVFPSDETALKWIFLFLKNVREVWIKILSVVALKDPLHPSIGD